MCKPYCLCLPCGSGIENWCSLQLEVHLQVLGVFNYQNADLKLVRNLTANPWAMALYTKWQFVPPLFLHVYMDHIGQHIALCLIRSSWNPITVFILSWAVCTFYVGRRFIRFPAWGFLELHVC